MKTDRVTGKDQPAKISRMHPANFYQSVYAWKSEGVSMTE